MRSIGAYKPGAGPDAPRYSRPPLMTAEYELVLMLDPETPDERRDEIASNARERIESGGSLKAEKAWGLRKLAYEIQQRNEADYRFFRFETESPLLDDLDHNLKITDGVLRFRIFKVDPDSPVIEPPPPGSARQRRPAPRRPPRPRSPRRLRGPRRRSAPRRPPRRRPPLPPAEPAAERPGAAPSPHAEAPAGPGGAPGARGAGSGDAGARRRPEPAAEPSRAPEPQ